MYEVMGSIPSSRKKREGKELTQAKEEGAM
jgi:hypothetical protein